MGTCLVRLVHLVRFFFMGDTVGGTVGGTVVGTTYQHSWHRTTQRYNAPFHNHLPYHPLYPFPFQESWGIGEGWWGGAK